MPKRLQFPSANPNLDLPRGPRYRPVEMLSVASHGRSRNLRTHRVNIPAPRTIAPNVAASNLAALPKYYEAMSSAVGPLKWWPAKTPFEVIVGAILTQNAAWLNVEKAIVNLRRERMLTVAAIERVPRARLARLIRSSGYFRQKAKKLKAFVTFLRKQYGGSLERMFRTPTPELRDKLLAVHGIGPETADSILLYAGKHSVFVVDAYTRRILQRHGHISEKTSDEEIRSFFEGSIPRDVQLYNEYHAQIVNVGKKWCRPKSPLCHACPLGPFLPSTAILPEAIEPSPTTDLVPLKAVHVAPPREPAALCGRDPVQS
ncbi:MAG TPA: endonuclease III domain-containing protein [Candidatus Dormibacteraeota bacterium]|nr:endonuclease III domain-containing protein [Candidatus Dormibacteraeota bacterium]